MKIDISIPVVVEQKSSIKVINGLAREVHKKVPEVPFEKVRRLYLNGRHNALNFYKIPRRVNGQKLGLRKRELLAETFEVR